MLPVTAVIQSSEVPSYRWILFGQSLLERNIRLLVQAGFRTIHLDLNESDMQFYNSKIKKYTGRFKDIQFIPGGTEKGKVLVIPANQFIMFGTFAKFDENFVTANGVYIPVKKMNQYEIKNNTDYANAKKFAIEVIRTGSGGKIAQNINKRISIPLSLLMARLRVLPNAITIFNFFLGVTSIVLILTDSHMMQAAGGILVQLCSIIDGCDGEVARMTTRFSKLGGIMDTVSDQFLAVALILSASYKVYINFPLAVFIINVITVVGGVALMMGIIIYFMRRYTESMSFASYNREFLDILPQHDRLPRAMHYLQYLARKELYSIMVCGFCLFGALHYYMLFFTLVAGIGAVLQFVTAYIYFPQLKQLKNLS